jgi:hypothetical protein
MEKTRGQSAVNSFHHYDRGAAKRSGRATVVLTILLAGAIASGYWQADVAWLAGAVGTAGWLVYWN